MLEGEGWRLERREEILSLLKKISGSPVEEAFSMAGALLSQAVGGQDNLLEVQKEEMEESLEVAMSLRHAAFIRNKLRKKHARQLSRKRSLGVNDILDIISSWYRDLLVYKLTGQDSFLVNRDHRDEIRDIAPRAKIERLSNVLKEIGKIRRMVEFYVNPGTAFEYLCLLLREV
jgi:DNA polymerase-3 subunit delta'